MNCSKCGTDLIDGTVICSLCGAKVEQDSLSPSAEAAKQKKPEKKLQVAFFAALALLVLGVAIFFGAQALSSLIGESSQSGPYMVVVTEGEALVYNGDSDPVRIEGDSYDEFVSLDGKTVGFAMNMVDTRHYSLVVYDGKEILEVDEDVCFFRISDNGSKVIYLADEDTEDFYGDTLFL